MKLQDELQMCQQKIITIQKKLAYCMETIAEKNDQIVILNEEMEEQHMKVINHLEENAIEEGLEFSSATTEQCISFIDQRMETDSQLMKFILLDKLEFASLVSQCEEAGWLFGTLQPEEQ